MASKIKISKEQLEKLYLEERKTMKEIGELLGVSWNSIRVYIHKFGIVFNKKHNKKDMTGLNFGNFKVLKESERKNKSRNQAVYWICECSCGKIKHVSGDTLRSGKSKSCGCLRKSKHKPYEEITMFYWNRIKKDAEKRNLNFTITLKYVWNLFLKQDRKCKLSNISIQFSTNCNAFKLEQTASLDRIDSSKGYIEGNVQWVHRDINWMKNNFNQEYYIEMCKKVANNSYGTIT